MARGLAAGAVAGGDGTIPPLRRHRTVLTAAAVGLTAAVALSSAVRSGAFWPLPVLLGIAAAVWVVRCVRGRTPERGWWFLPMAGGAYAAALIANVDPPDAWAALCGAALLAAAELAHTACGLPDLDIADRDTAVRYWRAAAVAVVGGFGAAELVLAAAGSGGTAGPEATALGVACICAALALMAVMARRAARQG